MSLRLGDIAPDFKAKTSLGDISLHEYLGDSWGILFSHPADFTPVCTTELGRTAALQEEFAKRNVKVLALSVDGVSSHQEWIKDINETQQVSVGFPIIADEDKSIAHAYDMIHPNASETFTVRSLFIIGPDKKLRLTMSYPMSVGRNFAEILRALDAIQITDGLPLATPANWVPGQDVIVGLALNNEQATAKYGELDIKLPYLRYAKAPQK